MRATGWGEHSEADQDLEASHPALALFTAEWLGAWASFGPSEPICDVVGAA